VGLTATADELRRRYAGKPDHYHALEFILRADDRYESLLPLLPIGLPSLHIDTTIASPDDVFAPVDAFLGLQGDVFVS
jgi:hypothetical protein